MQLQAFVMLSLELHEQGKHAPACKIKSARALKIANQTLLA
jgi:hypothetical protein